MPFNLGSAIGYLDLDTSKFSAGFQGALLDLKTFQSQTATLDQKMGALGSAFRSAGSSLTKSLTLPIVGAGTALVTVTSNFESSMSKVMAITDTTGQDAAEVYDKLSQKAKEMGATTRYSASEAADALYYMSLAGWNADESIAGLDGVLSLAAASGMDLGQASDMVTDYLTAFGLASDYASNMADALAYAQANSNTTTQLLGDAFGNCATQAKSFGSSLEETTSYLAALANSGLKGSEAGTALSAVFRDITQKMDNGKIAIGEASVAVMDAEGNFRSLTDILADVAAATEGLGTAEKSAALMETFTARSIKAVNILLSEGTDSINAFTEQLYASQGTAAEQSKAMLNNLQGQLTILKSALEGLAISFGELIIPYVTKAVQFITGLVNKLNSLDEGTKKTILTIAGIAAAIGPVLIIIGKVATGISSIIKVVTALKPVIAALNAVLAANPIILIIAAIAALVAAFIYLWNNCEEFRNFWINLWEGIKSVAVAVWEFLTDFFKSAWEGIKATATSVWNAISSFFTNVFNNISSFFTNTWTNISNFFVNTWNGMLSFFQNIGSTIGEAISSFVNDIVSWFAELPGRILEIGRQLVEGLWNGITSAANWLGDQISGFASTVLGWFKEAFGIASPSKKTREMGEYLMEGLGEGIEDEGQAILDDVDNMSQELLGHFKDGLAGAELGFGGSTDQAMLIVYNGYLLQTLALYKQIKEELISCNDMVSQMSLVSSRFIQDVMLSATEITPTPFGTTGSSTDSPTPDAPPLPSQGDSKPDTMVVNLTMNEETIETVIVDLVRREVRS